MANRRVHTAGIAVATVGVVVGVLGFGTTGRPLYVALTASFMAMAVYFWVASRQS